MTRANPEETVQLDDTLAALPPVTIQDSRARIKTVLEQKGAQIPILVVLDDDPTGTQTCHDVPVLTTWDKEQLRAELSAAQGRPGAGFFLLTNSRALHPTEARHLIAEICTNLSAAAREAGARFEIVLRSDSTLRGHFPLECDVVAETLGAADALLVCPFFLQGGRYTIDDVHYVEEEGKRLIPAAQTPFARDASFGFTHSDLREYVAEKSGGRIAAESVASLALTDIRAEDGVERVLKQLRGLARGTTVVVNAAAEEDMDVVILAILQAAEQGKRYLFRTAAAFVSSRLGIAPIAPISAEQLNLSAHRGGLIIAGSYVPKTTAQLETLTTKSGADLLTTIVLDVEKLLGSQSVDEIREAVGKAEEEIQRGQDVPVMTSRKLITGADAAQSLNIGLVVAKALVDFLQSIQTKPRYVIAKGGITSSDMATKALGFKRAMIVGQAATGVPLWRCDEPSSKWTGIPYVVFPGNVGSAETLYEVVQRWRPSSA